MLVSLYVKTLESLMMVLNGPLYCELVLSTLNSFQRCYSLYAR